MKKRKIVIISILLIIILGIICSYLFIKSDSYSMKKLSYSHIISTSINKNDQVNTVSIYTFNKDDICISVRVRFEFPDNQNAERQYDMLEEDDLVSNKVLQDNFVTINSNSQINMTKEDILKECKQKETSTDLDYNYIIY